MATRMGAPWVRIELHDRSAYSLVENPNAVAGVVGFAPRGELNKIQLLTNTAEQDTLFGLGFNNSRYNQGLYAASAVLNAGGYVEYVRPYGEEINKTDPVGRDLKSDAFVVTFDREALRNDGNPDKTSMKIAHFAATRYKVDGAASYGVTRKINNIAETIVNNTNVNFNIDASEEFAESDKSRGPSDMVLFAIINSDPSAASRAYDTYSVTADKDYHKTDPNELKLISASRIGFAVDDIVYAPINANSQITDILPAFRVKNIVDRTVYVVPATELEGGKKAEELIAANWSPDVLMYSDQEDILGGDYDYLTVKTAVTGSGMKVLETIRIDSAGLERLKDTYNGTSMVVRTQDFGEAVIRVSTAKSPTDVTVTPNTMDTVHSLDFTGDAAALAAFQVGDKVRLSKGTTSFEGTVTEIAEGMVKISSDTGFEVAESMDVSIIPTNWTVDTNAMVLEVTAESTVKSVGADMVNILRSGTIGLGAGVVVNDIAAGGLVDGTDTVQLVAGAAIDYVAGDQVAVTVAGYKLDTENGEIAPPDEDAILGLAQIKSVDLINGKVTFVEKLKLKTGINENLVYQLLNLTQSNRVVYGAFGDYNNKQTIEIADADFDFDAVVGAKKTAGYKVFTITGISGTVDTNYANEEITVTYDSRTATTTVDSEGAFTVTFEEADQFDVTGNEVPSCPVTTATIAGDDAVAVTGAVFTNNVKSEVMPTYSARITNVTVSFDGAEDATSKDQVTFAVDGVSGTYNLGTYADGKWTVQVGNGIETTVEGTRPGGVDTAPSAEDAKDDIKDIITDKKAITYKSKDVYTVYLVGNYTTIVPRAYQEDNNIFEEGDLVAEADKPFVFETLPDGHMVDVSDKVLVDTTVGSTFVGLGLANIAYEDVNFSGTAVKVYDLTDEGEEIARLYLSVAYRFNGTLYEFDGTVVPYRYGNTQLFIGDQAEVELTGAGATFVLNSADDINMFLEDNSYDLSSTVADGLPSGSTTAIAFNEDDPAIVHNAVWKYDPAKNINTSTIATAYNLFLNKDKSDVTFFVAAGMGLNNFGMRKYETLNTQVMQAILNICELRKDCFALFDGVAEPKIDTVLKLDSPASRFGSTLGRWGAIYDARPIFFDSKVTLSNVEAAPSIAMASLITANRKGPIFWHVPAGEDTGMVPGAWCTKPKYERVFTYPEDPDSDIARLCDIHVNPFRWNKKGIYVWGDFTMQMEDTAFNQIHVTMLVAGVHKMFYNYLDAKVFKLNTAALRAQITSDLQGELDKITYNDPAGFDEAYCICNDSNNTREIIDANRLYVDLMLLPTKSTRYIYLRTNVLSRQNGNVITTELSTMAR